MCYSRDCCVETCVDTEIPEPWRREARAARRGSNLDTCPGQQPAVTTTAGLGDCSGPISLAVDQRIDSSVMSQLSRTVGPSWSSLNNPWVLAEQDGGGDTAGVDCVYVDLSRNPERYTGYKGEDARKIWAAIYAQRAFQGLSDGMPSDGGGGGSNESDADTQGLQGAKPAQQVLYRLISGMHTSITASIVRNFYNETSGVA